MSKEQYAQYADAYKRDEKKMQKPDKYFATARRYCGMMLHLKPDMELSTFSTKLEKMIKMIMRYERQKHYVYSSFYEARGTQGVIGIAKALEQYNDYEKLTPNMAKKILKDIDNGNVSRKKRYCLLITTQLKDKKDANILLKLYNHPENRNGSLCHVMLASQKFNEGLDLKSVRHIHIFEPLLTKSMKDQTIGRARRYCSHSQYPSRMNWNVKIHEYKSTINIPMNNITANNENKTKQNIDKAEKNLQNMKGIRGVKNERTRVQNKIKSLKQKLKDISKKSKIPIVPSIDDIVEERSIRNALPMDEMLQSMRDAAIDCKIFKDFHNMNGRTVDCL
jgi:hypothetical protein